VSRPDTIGRKLEVPFNRPYVVGTELGYIQDAINNAHISGNGPFTRQCTELLRDLLKADSVLLTHSCTGALEMISLLADLRPGDEVIMPSFTFSSTATAFALRGATPVFVDIRSDTLNIDEQLVEAAITSKTKVIAAVHYAGVPCAMDALSGIAQNHGLVLIEDAAQAFGSAIGDRSLSTIGTFGALSFHETKNVISGEGGALVINNPRFTERAEILQEKGTNRRAFFRGQVDKYTWVDHGSSFAPSDLTAAYLYGQLERSAWINESRLAIWDRYHEAFADLEQMGKLRRPVVPAGTTQNGHMYYLLLPTARERDDMLASLAQAEVNAVFHYIPLHSSPAGRKLGRPVGDLSVTDRVSACLLRLPLWVDMGDDRVGHVIDSVYHAVNA
jgi:dTDP-4-amino-4,6-dideoxygalactose transaminase